MTTGTAPTPEVIPASPPEIIPANKPIVIEGLEKKLKGNGTVLLVHDVFEPNYAWIKLPLKDLVNLPPKARYTDEPSQWWWGLIPLAVAGGAALGYVIYALFGYFGATLIIPTWAMVVVPAVLGGVGAAIFKFLTIRVQTIYVFRLTNDGELAPITPKATLQEFMVDQKKPQVVRGPFLFRVWQQAPWQRFLRSRVKSYDKFMMPALFVLAGVLGLILFLLYFASQQQ